MFDNFNTDQIVDTLKNNSLNKTILHTSEKVESVINKKWILFKSIEIPLILILIKMELKLQYLIKE